jgi:hypothetical protein
MTVSASTASRILSPRRVLAGAGNPDSLENVNGQVLPDGAMCWVTAQGSWYTFEKFSSASPSGTSIIATVQGVDVPGRWSVVAGGASGGGTDYLFWESAPGDDETFMLPWQSFNIDGGSTGNPDTGAIPAPFDGVASLATLRGSVAATGQAAVHTVFKNGVATAIVVTVPEGQTLGVDDDNTFEFARGDFLAVEITASGAGNYWKFALGITPLP